MQELLDLFERVLGYPFTVDDEWDSVDNLYVTIEIERIYGIKFRTDEYFKYKTIPDLWEVVQAKRAIPKALIKAIAVDCDNTLWTGVVGEDGADNVAICYWLQEALVKAESVGYLICLCSKNNEQDVWEVFERRSMPLKKEHIVASEIHWGSKVDSIRALAERLNIGIDSFLFLDDSPIERQQVADALPEVAVYDPSMDQEWLKLLTNDESSSVSLTEKYRNAIEFRSDRSTDTQVDQFDFEKSLGMKGSIALNDYTTLFRCAEMSNKTNQCNLMLKRFSLPQMEEMFADPGRFDIHCGALSDRYGDHGIVGLLILEQCIDGWHVIEYCVSCRALGRRFEFAFYNKVVQSYPLIQHDPFVPGSKNQNFANFFEEVKNHQNVPIQWLPNTNS